jgi:hypothetical protein
MEIGFVGDAGEAMTSREQKESNKLMAKLLYSAISLIFLAGGTWVVATVVDHEKTIERHSTILESHTKILDEIKSDVKDVSKDVKVLIRRDLK